MLASPWLLVTPPETPLWGFYLLIRPFFLSVLSFPFIAGAQQQSPQGLLAKHKNSFSESLLLQIRSCTACTFTPYASYNYSSGAYVHASASSYINPLTTSWQRRWRFGLLGVTCVCMCVCVLRHAMTRFIQVWAIYHRERPRHQQQMGIYPLLQQTLRC